MNAAILETLRNVLLALAGSVVAGDRRRGRDPPPSPGPPAGGAPVLHLLRGCRSTRSTRC
ncbi:MAG: hypothetical protein WDN45_01930 [Caulobacteraceae bacterium]